MADKNVITVGIQSSEGTKRVEIPSSGSGRQLWAAVAKEFGDAVGADFLLYADQQKSKAVSKTASVRAQGIKHGQRLFMFARDGGSTFGGAAALADGGAAANGAAAAKPANHNSAHNNVAPSAALKSVIPTVAAANEDAVDKLLSKMDGRIARSKKAAAGRSMRIEDLPIEPYDETYLKEKNIKHMSFHAYLRKLSRGLDNGKFAAVEDISCSIKPNCPGGCLKQQTCTKCRPNPVTLKRQSYRHVDNITFENSTIVDAFLKFWRATGGCQRVGFLYGRYEHYPEVPLGIKAVVAAIYEPPQESNKDSVRLIPDDKEQIVEDVAHGLGLVRVGWIFTDLVQGATNGSVKHFRNMQSHFLSAQECIMAAHYQNQFPSDCSRSSAGQFGSKFVTVVATGNADNAVGMDGYQVSNQCQALVRGDILLPTKDAPELGYVRESSNEKYVPDVFFSEADEYGNDVTKEARRLPVEYLLTNVPTTTPKEPLATFYVNDSRATFDAFPIEHRPMEGHLQDFAALARYRRSFGDGGQNMLNFFKDFHLLVFMATSEDVRQHVPQFDQLLEALGSGNVDFVMSLVESDGWRTCETLMTLGFE